MADTLPCPQALQGLTKSLVVALGERDRHTRLHSERVVGLSLEVGRHCGLSAHELGFLSLAAEFHDLGKIGIPDRVLQKPAAFDDEEWAQMRQHPLIGERILLAIGMGESAEVARLVRHHHEHYDGRGYPDRLVGEAIPIQCRIISLADSYDAIAVSRPYHPPRGHRDIMGILDGEAGSKHDPVLFQAFCTVIDGSALRAPAS